MKSITMKKKSSQSVSGDLKDGRPVMYEDTYREEVERWEKVFVCCFIFAYLLNAWLIIC
jgi:hypothetical protein